MKKQKKHVIALPLRRATGDLKSIPFVTSQVGSSSTSVGTLPLVISQSVISQTLCNKDSLSSESNATKLTWRCRFVEGLRISDGEMFPESSVEGFI